MAKTPQPSKTKQNPPQVSTWWSEVTMFYPIRQVPINDGWIDKLAEDLLNWVSEPKSLMIEQFWISRKIDNDHLSLWMERNENLRRAMKIVMMTLYTRREIGTINKKFEPKTTHFTMPHYSDMWKNLEQWRANLGLPVENATGIKYVIMEKFPESDKVPHRHTDLSPEEVAASAHKDTASNAKVPKRQEIGPE